MVVGIVALKCKAKHTDHQSTLTQVNKTFNDSWVKDSMKKTNCLVSLLMAWWWSEKITRHDAATCLPSKNWFMLRKAELDMIVKKWDDNISSYGAVRSDQAKKNHGNDGNAKKRSAKDAAGSWKGGGDSSGRGSSSWGKQNDWGGDRKKYNVLFFFSTSSSSLKLPSSSCSSKYMCTNINMYVLRSLIPTTQSNLFHIIRCVYITSILTYNPLLPPNLRAWKQDDGSKNWSAGGDSWKKSEADGGYKGKKEKQAFAGGYDWKQSQKMIENSHAFWSAVYEKVRKCPFFSEKYIIEKVEHAKKGSPMCYIKLKETKGGDHVSMCTSYWAAEVAKSFTKASAGYTGPYVHCGYQRCKFWHAYKEYSAPLITAIEDWRENKLFTDDEIALISKGLLFQLPNGQY